MAPEDVVIKFNKSKNKDGTYSYSASATVNLTIVDQKNVFNGAQQIDLQNIVQGWGGTIYTSIGGKSNVPIDVNVSLNLNVVSDLKNAKSTDFIIQTVADIPDNFTPGSKTIGLATGTGDVGAVEANLRQLAPVTGHELGHILGLDHTSGTIMNKSTDSNPNNQQRSLNDAQKKQLWQFIGNYKNSGTYRALGTPEDSRLEMPKFISSYGITK
ncbi:MULTISPECIES: matrixin family metalloprotease [Chitinophagaceae]